MTANTPPEKLLRRLEWRVLRRLDGRVQGAYRTLFRGSGIDVTGLRAYAPEDDSRHIDWNVTARLSEPHVRVYLQDRELTAWLVLDRSPSMELKHETLAGLAVSLARVLGQGGNKVGAVLYDNGQHTIVPPSTGRDHVLRLAREITAPTGRSATSSAAGPRASGDRTSTDLAAMLALVGRVARRRGLVFVVSDLIGEGDWSTELGRLGARHEVVVLRLVEPSEWELPDLGLVLVEDAETGEQVFADTSDPLLRARFTEQVAARESIVADGLRRAGVTAHTIGTDADLAWALIDMVEHSRRRRA